MTVVAENPTKRPYTILHDDCLESDIFDNVYQREVYIALKKFCNSNNQCFPSLNKIASITKMCKRTVQKALQALKDKFLINIQHRFKPDGSKTSNLYTVYDSPELWATDNKMETDKITVEEPEEVKNLQDKSVLKKEETTPVVVEPQIQIKSNKKELVSNYNQSIDTSTNNITGKDNTIQSEKSQPLETYSFEWIKNYFSYSSMVDKYPNDRDKIDSVFNILHTTLNTTNGTIRIKGNEKPIDVVKGKLFKLTEEDTVYAIGIFLGRTDKITNATAYMLTLLYNAPEQRSLETANLIQYNKAQKNEQTTESSEIVGSIPIQQQQSGTWKNYNQDKPKNKFDQFSQREVTQEELDELERELLKL